MFPKIPFYTKRRQQHVNNRATCTGIAQADLDANATVACHYILQLWDPDCKLEGSAMTASMIRLEICWVDFRRHDVKDLVEALTRLGVCFTGEISSVENFISLFPLQSLVMLEFRK
jgi:hypothetical protein